MPRTTPRSKAPAKTRPSARASTPRTAAAAPRPEIAATLNSIRRVVRALRLAEQQTRAQVGLSAAQLFILSHLNEASASSLGELAERTLTDRSSVAAVVDRLEEARLVVTERSADDRRRVLVRISEAGRRKLRFAPAAPTTQLIGALERMPADEVHVLSAHLARLVEAMGLSDEPAGMLFEDRASSRARLANG